MGKCVSKDHHIRIKELADSSTYIAITDEFEYFHHEKVSAKLEYIPEISHPEHTQKIPEAFESSPDKISQQT